MRFSKFKQTMNKLVPKFAVWPLISIVVTQFLVYFGTKWITQDFAHTYPALPIDDYIPFIPGFIYIYVGCYVHWFVNYIMSAHSGERHFFRFYKAAMLCYALLTIIYIVFPTTIDRPNLDGIDGLTGFLCNAIYSADTPVNLFPSLHCIASWFSWIAIRGKKNIPLWYRVFSFVLGILVCVSTVTVKQHFFIDIIGGIAITELSWFVIKVLSTKRKRSV